MTLGGSSRTLSKNDQSRAVPKAKERSAVESAADARECRRAGDHDEVGSSKVAPRPLAEATSRKEAIDNDVDDPMALPPQLAREERACLLRTEVHYAPGRAALEPPQDAAGPEDPGLADPANPAGAEGPCRPRAGGPVLDCFARRTPGPTPRLDPIRHGRSAGRDHGVRWGSPCQAFHPASWPDGPGPQRGDSYESDPGAPEQGVYPRERAGGGDQGHEGSRT